jgi:DNA polymerase elongation subunit (family B)
LANFIQGSLNELAKKYLDKEKIEDIDSPRLNVDLNYWKESYDKIIQYCIMDAKLTKELSDYFWDYMRESLNFNPYSPYSKGSISQEYFLYKCFIPTINHFLQNEVTKDILRHAYYAYSGGRFELLRRGYFKDVYLYDLKSAYPSEISKLIDYSKGIWVKTKNPENYIKGFWYCNIEFFHDLISPFMQKISGLNVYPIGKFKQYLTKNEIEFILKNFKEVNIDPLSGYGFVPRQDLNGVPYLPYMPFGLMEYVYRLKEEAVTEEKRNAQKIIANSLYGKFIQTVGGHTGKLFNPLWASEITANTRLKLLEVALTNNNLKHVIGFSTDSIFIDKPIQDKFIGSKMGEWELKFQGWNGIFLMTDIYSIKTVEGNEHKLRGFKIKLKKEDKEEDWITVYNILNKLDKDLKFKYKITRPINLGECIIQNKVKNLSMLNIWKEDIKEININGDTKRIWEDDFHSGLEPIKIAHTSIPILI